MVRSAIIRSVIWDLDDSVEDSLERISSVGYDGVELGMQDDHERAAAVADRFDLTITSIMTGLGEVRSPEDGIAAACATTDTEYGVLGWLDESYYDSPETTEETAQLINECADRMADHDLTLCYHNHDHEFDMIAGHTPMDVLLKHLDDRVKLEVDVGWVGVGGVSPADFIEEHSDRIPLIHLRDMDYETGESVPLGDGDVDVAGVLRAAECADVQWAIYEHGQPDDAAASMTQAIERMRKKLGGDDQ